MEHEPYKFFLIDLLLKKSCPSESQILGQASFKNLKTCLIKDEKLWIKKILGTYIIFKPLQAQLIIQSLGPTQKLVCKVEVFRL